MEGKKLEREKFSLFLSRARRSVVSVVVIISIVVLNALLSKGTVGSPNQIGLQSRNLSEHPAYPNEYMTNEDGQEVAEDALGEVTEDLYESSQGNGNTVEEHFQSVCDESELSEKCHIVFHSFEEEDINEIINSVNDNLFKREILERWIQLHEDAAGKVQSLKEHLSYYLEKLKSLYNVDENIAEEQMRENNYTIESNVRMTKEYHNKLFFYYIIKDNLPESDYESFINIARNAFNLFINELVTMGERTLNKCVPQ